MSGPRSLLIMPANRADMLAKAPTYGADALVAIRLPKAESAEMIRTVDAILTGLEKQRGLPQGSIVSRP